MKIYISADMEGVAGITHWDEALKTRPDYHEFRERMTREVVAACHGAIDAGATDILIKDAHGSGRNILAAELPECARLVRGWSGHPCRMLQELDSTFSATLMIGYHARAGSDGNPLAHTLLLRVDEIRINDVAASEFLLHAYLSNYLDVPVAFVSGDREICDEAGRFNANVTTVAVSHGVGASTVSVSPRRADQQIADGVERALGTDLRMLRRELPAHFVVEIRFNDPVSACRASFYPGMRDAGPRKVAFETHDYFEVMRMLQFVVS